MFASVSRSRVQAPPGHLSAILVGRRAIWSPRRQNSTQPGPPKEERGPAGQGEKLETSASTSPSGGEKGDSEAPPSQEKKSRRKTMAEQDEELKKKMAGMAGDGGEAGIEYEDGQPVAMKRSVKNNMFRYI